MRKKNLSMIYEKPQPFYKRTANRGYKFRAEFSIQDPKIYLIMNSYYHLRPLLVISAISSEYVLSIKTLYIFF